jgi:hypothetical protein
MMSFVLYNLSQRRFPLSYDWKTVLTFVALAALAGAGGVLMQDQPWTLRLTYVVVMSLAYPLVGMGILLRSSDERERMLHLLKKLRGRRKGTKATTTSRPETLQAGTDPIGTLQSEKSQAEAPQPELPGPETVAPELSGNAAAAETVAKNTL